MFGQSNSSNALRGSGKWAIDIADMFVKLLTSIKGVPDGALETVPKVAGACSSGSSNAAAAKRDVSEGIFSMSMSARDRLVVNGDVKSSAFSSTIIASPS